MCRPVQVFPADVLTATKKSRFGPDAETVRARWKVSNARRRSARKGVTEVKQMDDNPKQAKTARRAGVKRAPKPKKKGASKPKRITASLSKVFQTIKYWYGKSKEKGVPFAYPPQSWLGSKMEPPVDAQQISRQILKLEALGAIRVANSRDDPELQRQIGDFQERGLMPKGPWCNVYWPLVDKLEDLDLDTQPVTRERQSGGGRRRRGKRVSRPDQPGP
jgi:hypothetical protein